jgi:hypothetical protein
MSKLSARFRLEKDPQLYLDAAVSGLEAGATSRHLLPRPLFAVQADTCEPETSVNELNGYASTMTQHYNEITQVVTELDPENERGG